MISNDKLFGNIFDAENITPTRFLGFSRDSLNKLIAANTDGRFTITIALITPLIGNLGTELGDVDVSLTLQVGKTRTNDEEMANFSKTMSDEEPFIARALGGRGTEAYLQFYLHGITEYTEVTKTQMPTLTIRVNAAATANATALGPTLTATLQAFEADWLSSRDTQEQKKADVGDDRTGRNTALGAAQLGMLTAVHTVAGMYPGNVEQCSHFFSFSMLFAPAQHPHVHYISAIAPLATVQLQNKSFKTAAKITASNPDDNATTIIWLAPTPTTPPPAEPVTIYPGESKVLTPADLGNPHDTFLLIKNLSDLNEGAYDVEIVE